MSSGEARWSVYVLRCRDGSLYTGISTDVERRVVEHGTDGKGAKYLRGRGPANVVFQWEIGSRSLATRAEMRIKRLSKGAKEELIASRGGLSELLTDLAAPQEV